MKTFIDTSPFIYLIQNHSHFVNQVKDFIVDAVNNGEELITSVITVMEFGVMPEKTGRQDILLKFEDFLNLMNIPVAEIDHSTATRAYKLRAKYDFLKGMDALQVPVALEKSCDQFLTNDKRLSRITELKIVIVEDL